MNDRRVLIVSFDALRPEMATRALMPNLRRFADAGVTWTQSRSTFPTETRVNQTALVTGCHPERHGIVGNRFVDPVAAPGRLFNTGDESELKEGDERLGGKLLGVPSLGELLAEAGKSYASLSAGTPGGGRMLHHKAETVGGFRMALHAPEATVGPGGPDTLDAVTAKVGGFPEYEIPSIAWNRYAADIYLGYIAPELQPDVTVLWFCEPDSSYHYKGIGSADNLAAMRGVDADFGRILAWRDGPDGPGEALQIVTLSDHGQITVAAESIGLADKMAAAGFSVGATLEDGADVALALSSAGGIYVRRSDPALIAEIVAWLQKQDWCGPVSTRDGAGALKHADLFWDHPRAPDIGLVLKAGDSVNDHGHGGHTLQNAAYPTGGGLHGGLHRAELHNWLAAGGDAFGRNLSVDCPAGIADVLPTVFSVLGLAVPDHVQGRVLAEGLADGSLPQDSGETACRSAEGADGYRAHLEQRRYGGAKYLEAGWAERG
jgi:phosphonoacetate hydrolase